MAKRNTATTEDAFADLSPEEKLAQLTALESQIQRASESLVPDVVVQMEAVGALLQKVRDTTNVVWSKDLQKQLKNGFLALKTQVEFVTGPIDGGSSKDSQSGSTRVSSDQKTAELKSIIAAQDGEFGNPDLQKGLEGVFGKKPQVAQFQKELDALLKAKKVIKEVTPKAKKPGEMPRKKYQRV
jgi:hypothetical protein